MTDDILPNVWNCDECKKSFKDKPNYMAKCNYCKNDVCFGQQKYSLVNGLCNDLIAPEKANSKKCPRCLKYVSVREDEFVKVKELTPIDWNDKLDDCEGKKWSCTWHLKCYLEKKRLYQSDVPRNIL